MKKSMSFTYLECIFNKCNKEGTFMFHKIKYVTPLQDFKISIQFAEGITKIYDMKKLIENNKLFADLYVNNN